MQLATWRCIWSQCHPVHRNVRSMTPDSREMLKRAAPLPVPVTATSNSNRRVMDDRLSRRGNLYHGWRWTPRAMKTYAWLLITYDLCWRRFFQRKGRRCQMSQNLNTWPAGCCASSCSPSWLQPGQLTPPGKTHQVSGIRSYTACWHDNLRNITTRSNGSERRFGPQLVDCSDCSLAQGLVYFIILWNVCICLSFETGLSVVLLILPLNSTTPRQI